MKSQMKCLSVGLLSLALTACALQNAEKKGMSQNQSAPVREAKKDITEDEKWKESLLETRSARIHVKSLQPKFQEELKSKFRVPELDEIKSNFSGTFILYRAKNIENAEKIVFIQPKLFVYGSSQGGNVLKVITQDGRRVTLSIPVAFVDGLKRQLVAYEQKGAIPLPDTLVIPDTQELLKDLTAQLGHEVELQVLPPDLRELNLVHVRGGQNDRYRLTPAALMDGRAPVNEFFTVSLTASRDAVTDLIQNSLETGLSVQILSKYRLAYQFPSSVFTVDFSPVETYQAIREQFIAAPFGMVGSDPTLYSASQLIAPLQKILLSSITSTGANPAWIPYSQGINLLEDLFFDDVTGLQSCPSNQHCFRVKKESEVNFNGPIEMMWVQKDTLGVSDPVSSVTLIKGLDESFPLVMPNQRSIPMTSEIPSQESCNQAGGNIPGCVGFSCEKFPESAYCRRGESKAPVTQFQVFPESKLKISLSKITEWRYELTTPRDETPEEKRKGVLKCANMQEIAGACEEYKAKCPVDLVNHCPQPKEECDHDEKLYEDHCTDEVRQERDCGFLGTGYCSEVVKERTHRCEKVEIGKYCSHYKTTCLSALEKVCPKEMISECVKPAKECEQYTVETFARYSFSDPWATPKQLDLVGGQNPEKLWEGIEIEFSWLKEDGTDFEHVTCPLLAFPHWLDGGHSITVTLSNQEASSCRPFTPWNQQEGRWPFISMINRIQFNRTYQCGNLEWTHSVDSSSEKKVRDTLTYYCPATNVRSNMPVHAWYSPIVDLEGTVSLLGRSIGTISSQVQRIKP